MTPGVRTFLASFLVLLLEVALIRWMPAYVRLLAYFSNFILLASFLGIGIGCLLAPARRGLFTWFPAILIVVIGTVYFVRLEIAVPESGSIYFTSGTTGPRVTVESTLLLPVMFVIVAALFAALAQRMAREMAALPPLRAYTVNLAGSLAGVVAFALMSWMEWPPVVWFGVACATAVPLLASWPGLKLRPAERLPIHLVLNLVLLAASLGLVHVMARGTLWSPYYRIDVRQVGNDTVVDVNNIFHQSMAPLAHKEYFYEWPYTTFPSTQPTPQAEPTLLRAGGESFEDVLILGAGSGTDVAAALKHRVRHVDAVEIDPAILRLGLQRHPDQPYQDPRVTMVTDDARHFLRTTQKKYDLVVFALIDSLTMQSSFSGVRLESYMFTEESFRAVRERLKPDGLLVVYNYFRERWLVDRLANTAAVAFGEEPRVHVHEARAYLGVLMAGPRLAQLASEPVVPDRVTAFGQSHEPAPARRHQRDRSIEPATDDWPFLYLRDRHIPSHYLGALALILVVSVAAIVATMRVSKPKPPSPPALKPPSPQAPKPSVSVWSWQFFLLGAGFMLLETRAITQFALLWGSTWVVASLAIASVLTMALAANYVVSRREITRPWIVGGALVALLAVNFLIPVGRIAFDSRAVESAFYAVLMFSPILCAGLLFGSAIKRSTSVARDYGTNLLGAMVGGVGEYLSLVTGFRTLLILIAACYLAALAARQSENT